MNNDQIVAVLKRVYDRIYKRVELEECAMSYKFPPQLDQLVRQQMALGNYTTEDEMLVDALRALHDKKEDLAAVQEGIDDMMAGRMKPLAHVADEIAVKYGF